MPLADQWLATAKISSHRVKTDDYSSFPWGVPGDQFSGLATDAYFTPTADFGLYDYRSINEQRHSQAISFDITGRVTSGETTHTISFGGEFLEHVSTKPEYLYAYVGEGNANLSSWAGDPSDASGRDVFRREVRQSSLHLSDRLALGAGSLSLSLRWVQMRDSYRADFDPDFYTPIPWGGRRDHWLLPAITYSLAPHGQQQIWASYRQDIEAGAVAPLSSANNGEVLPARRLYLLELGTKAVLRPQLEASAVVFRSWRPHNFRNDNPVDPLSSPVGDYLQRGKESRTGLELAAAGRLAPGLQAQISATYLDSDTSGLGNAAFEGKQALNIPKLRMAALVDYRMPNVSGLSVWAGGFYVGKRPANRDNSMYVPAYHRVDFGAAFAMKAVGQKQTYRFTVENIFNKAYWRDSAEFLGDAYLTPGAPRIFKLSATTTF
jgi:iron complex outermembrane receptor protein